jgi:hypothetical protein
MTRPPTIASACAGGRLAGPGHVGARVRPAVGARVDAAPAEEIVLDELVEGVEGQDLARVGHTGAGRDAVSTWIPWGRTIGALAPAPHMANAGSAI